MMPRTRLPLEPRLLSRELAAAYCGLSVPTFETTCPVRAVRFRSRVLYDRRAIDRWLDSVVGVPVDNLGGAGEPNPWD